jgi:hypothetical protein
MWVLAIAIYFGCKWLTWRRTPAPNAPAWRVAAYMFAWPGMDAQAFLNRISSRPRVDEWILAFAKLLCGLLLLYGVVPAIPGDYPYIQGWTGMIGIVLILHFGIFHLLSCFWRYRRIDARPLMNAPLISTSLAEFWGRRWNTAFRDLTHRFLFRPLITRLGAKAALAIGFIVSGLVHDVVISIPAGAGYGGPTAFFLIQGAAIFIERTPAARRLGLGRGPTGWLFAMLVLAAPSCLMFHRLFVLNVVLPFLHVLRAI